VREQTIQTGLGSCQTKAFDLGEFTLASSSTTIFVSSLLRNLIKFVFGLMLSLRLQVQWAIWRKVKFTSKIWCSHNISVHEYWIWGSHSGSYEEFYHLPYKAA
jgi:hypothetical protein